MSTARLTLREPRGTAWLRRWQAPLACALLLIRTLLAVVPAAHTGLLPAGAACAGLLGGCMWWVAKRQLGPWAGVLALALWLASPVWRAGLETAVALLLFVLLYTAAGVAHAVQGPRKKWPPRFVLLSALAGATAWLSPQAAAVGLVLGLGCMLYLGQGRRQLLVVVCAGAAMLATIAALLRPMGAGALAAGNAYAGPGFGSVYAGDALALVLALGFWAAHRRSRFFGNTAPLLASVVCLAVGHGVWALAPALLFVAGVFADALDVSLRRAAAAAAVACVLAQVLAGSCKVTPVPMSLQRCRLAASNSAE